jgi:hypothetical protein
MVLKLKARAPGECGPMSGMNQTPLRKANMSHQHIAPIEGVLISEVVVSEAGLHCLILEGQINQVEQQLEQFSAATARIDIAIRALEAERSKLASQRSGLLITRNKYLAQISELATKRQL